MSLAEIQIRAEKVIPLSAPGIPGLQVIMAGNVGPPGPSGKWEAMTQNEYDMLNPPDPDILYIIIQ